MSLTMWLVFVLGVFSIVGTASYGEERERPCQASVTRISGDTAIRRLPEGQSIEAAAERLERVRNDLALTPSGDWAMSFINNLKPGQLSPRELLFLGSNLTHYVIHFVQDQIDLDYTQSGGNPIVELPHTLEGFLLKQRTADDVELIFELIRKTVEQRKLDYESLRKTQHFNDQEMASNSKLNRLQDVLDIVHALQAGYYALQLDKSQAMVEVFLTLERAVRNIQAVSWHGVRCTKAEGGDCAALQRSFRCESLVSLPQAAYFGGKRKRPNALCEIWAQHEGKAEEITKHLVLNELDYWIRVISP